MVSRAVLRNCSSLAESGVAGLHRRSIQLLFGDWIPQDEGASRGLSSIWLLWSKHRILDEGSLYRTDDARSPQRHD